MKKLNNKGFTLIELLAVITIMGILMMVAIPSVSRTIENSRRDTFANVCKTYVNAVRNAVLADELQCGAGNTSVGATGNGVYYYEIDTSSTTSDVHDLLESGGKSSWGNADVRGYVTWTKTSVGSGDNAKIKTTYAIKLADSGNHGLTGQTDEKALTRTTVKSTGGTYAIGTPTVPSGVTAVKCTLK